MTRAALSRALALAVGVGCFAAVPLACAGDDNGRDFAAGWRALLAIRGAEVGEPVSLQRADYADATRVGVLASAQLSETSGLATSRRRDDLLWAINDSGRAPRLHALGLDGSDRGYASVEGASSVDWEDVASFELDGRAYLLVADTGDNLSWRKQVELIVVEEPELTGESVAANTALKPAWRIAFAFEDGPRDCEAVAVDLERERILLIAKRTEPPGLYELPLRPQPTSDGAIATARRIGDVPGIPPPTRSDVKAARLIGRYFAMPTALDISADGRRAALLTYREAYLFERATEEPWEAAFARPPQRIATPAMAQAEGLTFARDGRTLFVTTEGTDAPLFRLLPRGTRVSLRRE